MFDSQVTGNHMAESKEKMLKDHYEVLLKTIK